MTFTVIWRQVALDRLAEIRMNAADRAAISRAADRIDAELRSHGKSAGESRDADRRILTIAPLSVYFEVLEQDRRIEVTAVWLR